MSTSAIIPSLMFVTIGIVLLIAILVLARFMRKRSNRHPMDHHRERNIDEIKRGVPPGE